MAALAKALLALVPLVGLAASGASSAQDGGPACTGEEYRQLDFWLGEWDAEVDTGGGVMARAHNSITRGLGGCVIVEQFRLPAGDSGGGDFIGSSYSIYDRLSRSWRQMWVDNAGNMFDLRGGPVTGQAHVFELVNIEPRGAGGATLRMIWQDVSADRFVWRWQRRAQADGSWNDLWVIRYTRRTGP